MIVFLHTIWIEVKTKVNPESHLNVNIIYRAALWLGAWGIQGSKILTDEVQKYKIQGFSNQPGFPLKHCRSDFPL